MPVRKAVLEFCKINPLHVWISIWPVQEHLIANILISFSQWHGIPHDLGILIQKSINKSECARVLGLSRRSVIRAFSRFEKQGLIQSEGPKLVILNLEALKQISLCALT